ncbi:MAG: Iron hydrogenase 1 [bacterium ADurb.Bin212]|nr:MAG: Iron hydrogenase 1 [bacterium ADurb.Bin212]
MSQISISINGRKYQADEGETVLQVAQREDIYIPALCYHCDLLPHESCRLCMVEIEGEGKLKASCTLKAFDGLRVLTDSELVNRVLAVNLELLFAQHEGKCEACARKDSCKLRQAVIKFSNKEKFVADKYSDRKKDKLKYQFGPSIMFDPAKCINCENCATMCAKQTKGGFIRPRESKYNFEVSPSLANDHDCIYCGQCIVHCPTGALSEVEDYPEVQKLLKDSTKKVVFQFAPAIRSSIGELFGLPPGEIATGKIFSSLKRIGAYKVFDTSFGADVTIMEESEELINKIVSGENEVMFSSCCPAWVKYLEFYEKGFVKYLTSVRSPHIILGGLIKTHWAKHNNINPKDIVVVSIMPCTAKKFEAKRRELRVNGFNPVDIVITNREFAKLLKEANINLADVEPSESNDDIMGSFTGAGEIFGASGGVLEAAIRTAYFKTTGKSLEHFEFKAIHELNGIKELELKVNNQKLRFAAVSGIENVKIVLDKLKSDPTYYSCVEVMACPGGCVAGGGQPLPIDDEIRKMRSKGLYKADRENRYRESHANPDVVELYKGFFESDRMRHRICHTKFAAKNKGVIKRIK